MHNLKKKERGLAILTTLLIIVLLLGLIAAFLTVNQAGNRFTLSSVERRQAQDTCLTAFAYAQFQVEAERTFAEDGSPIGATEYYPLGSPVLRVIQTQPGPEGLVTGVYSESQDWAHPTGTFEMKIWNNLKSRTPMANPGDGPVPARSVRIDVVGKVGGITRNLSAMLRPVPQSFDSASAGGDIRLDDSAGIVRISSKDPYINRIRAGQNLNLPAAEDVQFLKHGVGASTTALNLGGLNLQGATTAQVQTQGETSGGVYAPNASAPQIKAFDPNEISLPNNTSNIEAGDWVFGTIGGQDFKPADINYDEVVGYTPTGTPIVKSGKKKRHQKRTTKYNQLTSPSGTVYPAKDEIPGSASPFFPPVPTAPLSSEAAAASWGFDGTEPPFPTAPGARPKQEVHNIAPGFDANVQTAQMVVNAETSIRAPGDFVVLGVDDRKPEMYFGYQLSAGGVATQTSLDDGIEAAQDDPSKYMAAVIADGDVNITGGVLGYGSMLAGGDLHIRASSGLRSAPGLGVAIKGTNIIIDPATEPEPSVPGEPVDADYPVFRSAINAESGGDWSFYDAWLDHDQTAREARVLNLKTTDAGISASTAWSTFGAQIGDGGAMPALAGWPAGNITLDQYARLKEFYQTKAFGYNDGLGDDSWLDLSVRTEDAEGRVGNVVNGIAQWARSYGQTFQAYLSNPDQGPPDMFLEGLVYAEQDLIIHADGQSVRLEGSIVAQHGDLDIVNPSKVDLVYNRDLLDDLLHSEPTGPIKLQKVFFSLD